MRLSRTQRIAALLLIAMASTSCMRSDLPNPQDVTASTRDFYLGGIQIHEAEPEAWFGNLMHQGMNTVHITDYAVHGDWDSDDLNWDAEKPWLVDEIRGAKERGLAVVLVLRVALDEDIERNAFMWHGMIMPKTDEQLDSWFDKFTDYCAHWAKTAEELGVDALFLGSELNALASTLPADQVPMLEEYFLNEQKQEERRQQVLAQRELLEQAQSESAATGDFETVEDYLEARIASERTWAETMVGEGSDGQDPAAALNARRARLNGHWSELISEIRGIYSGPLGYAANFDQFRDVGFWQQFDLVGINAYFKLRYQVFEEFDEATLYPLLLEGWRRALQEISDFRTARGLEDKPVVFTELGYTWRRRSTLKPWSHTGFAVIDQPSGSQQGGQQIVVWQDQPKELRERALAVRALHQAYREQGASWLRGLLYWKLSSHDYHEKDEAFMLHIGEGSQDPTLAELRRFVETPDV